ncbi:uncharacterized protein LOC110981987 [Acanthaster planci]|uniref:Uncharacterized protein LOC110981987 n=1 Tax=Acanthaster planci TaxID=133434 RepID=A0A8B7YR50_ACAPL|nr:uncharacterized protein LOC110981987 [Acanthaster planci]
MASAQSEDDGLICSICLDYFRQPKVLDCLHSFCLECLRQLKQKEGLTGERIVCPLCRGHTTLHEWNVDELPDNQALSAQVKKRQSWQGQRSAVSCQNCDEGNQAISKCIDCDSFLCQECHKAHGRMAVMRTHEVCMLGSSTADQTRQAVIPTCQEHQGQQMSNFCSTFMQLVCTSCHSYKNHPTVCVEAVLDEYKKQATKLNAQGDKTMAEIKLAMLEADELQKKLDDMFEKTTTKITQKADREVAKIRAEEKKLKQEAQRIYKDRVKTFEAARTANQTEAALVEQMQCTLRHQACHTNRYTPPDLEKFICSIFTLQNKKPKGVPDRLSFLDFTEGGFFGRLVLDDKLPQEIPASEATNSQYKSLEKEKWQLWNEEINTFSRKSSNGKERCVVQIDHAVCIAAFSNNKLVTITFSIFEGWTQWHLISFKSAFGKYMPQWEFTSEFVVKVGSFNSKIKHILVNKDDQAIILINNAVKILSKDYKTLHMFESTVRGTATCLATDDASLIAVGCEDTQEVSLHSTSGSLFKRLRAPMIGNYLTIHKKQLIYTNWAKRKLLAINDNGDSIFSTDVTSPEERWGPTGVCCSKNGSIYVAVCGEWPSAGQIQQYSPEGVFVGCIIERCCTVYGMTLLDDDKKLAVAAKTAVKIFRRVKRRYSMPE